MRRPRGPAAAGGKGREKAPPGSAVVVGVKDADGVPAVIAVDGKGGAPVQGVLFVAESGCGEKAPLDAGTAVGGKDAEGVAVIAVGVKDGASAQGDPVVPAVDREVDKPMGKGGVAEKDEEGIKWLKHYSSMQSILIVGDGDFSFSLSLATAFGSGQNLVATSLDTYEDLTKKYVKAESNVTELKSLGAAVLHGVDAKEMKLHPFLKMRRFDRIVFNFPHAGFDGKEDDLHMIKYVH